MQRFTNNFIYFYKENDILFVLYKFDNMKAKVSVNTLLLVLTFILVSCESNEKSNIALSAKYLQMSSKGESTTIFVDGKDWWINDVKVEGIRLYASPEDIERDCESIEGDWFIIEKDG
ncbi:MAG TPA: hypothetical protein DIT04_10565, partial [Dysgonomonas sp.]|nr:hypothetical protein [Dysgonomonas sp.]